VVGRLNCGDRLATKIVSAFASSAEDEDLWVLALTKISLHSFVGCVRITDQDSELFFNDLIQSFSEIGAQATNAARTTDEYLAHTRLLVCVNAKA
jgi:hypothetical protein